MKIADLKEKQAWKPLEERGPGTDAFTMSGVGYFDLETFTGWDNAIFGHFQQGILGYLKLNMEDQIFEFRRMCKLIQRTRFDCKSHILKQYALTFLCGLNELVVQSVARHRETASLKYWPDDHAINYLFFSCKQYNSSKSSPEFIQPTCQMRSV